MLFGIRLELANLNTTMSRSKLLMMYGLLAFLSVSNMVSFAKEAGKEEVGKKKEGKKGKVVHQIGINAATFLDRFFKFNNSSSGLIDPYLFTYRAQFANGLNIRFGLGASTKNQDLVSSTSSMPRNDNSSSMHFRLGFEYYLLKTKKWKAGAGIDAVYAKSNSNSRENDPSSGLDFEQKSESFSYGAGPLLSIQYFVHPRVSIGTEGSMHLEHSETFEKQVVNGQFPSLNSNTLKVNSLSSNFPVAFFINFNF